MFPPSTREQASHHGTILLVDDDEDVRELVALILSSSGHQVLPASSGEAALRVAAHHPAHIDLLLTDVRMPGMGGPALAEQLRSRQPGLRVLFMSGYPGSPLGQGGGLELGMNLLAKPFTLQELERRVHEALGEPVQVHP